MHRARTRAGPHRAWRDPPASPGGSSRQAAGPARGSRSRRCRSRYRYRWCRSLSSLLMSLVPMRGSGRVGGDQREPAGQLVVAPQHQSNRGHLRGNHDAAADLGVGEHVTDDLAHVLDEAERRTLVPATEPGADVRAAARHRDVDAPLRGGSAEEATGCGNALTKDPAHLVARSCVDVAAKRVTAAALIDAEVLHRDPARPRPGDRPVDAIEHVCPPASVTERRAVPRCAAVSPGSRDTTQTVRLTGGTAGHNHRAVLAVLKPTPAPGFVIGDVPMPSPAAGQILLRVAATSVCGTDVHLYDWNPWAAARVHPPRIVGHEVCGEVVEWGEVIGGPPIGARVAVESHIV